MIDISFLFGEVFFTVIWFGIRIFTCIRRKKFDLKQELLLLLMYVNLAVIIRMTFYPYEKINGHVQPLMFDKDYVLPLKVNFAPFIHITEYDTKHDTLLNIIGNIGMFVPSGIVLPIIYKKLDNFVKVISIGALISLSIEILQLPFFTRTSDIDDLILNTIGCAFGYLIYAAVKKIIYALRNSIVQNNKKGAAK